MTRRNHRRERPLADYSLRAFATTVAVVGALLASTGAARAAVFEANDSASLTAAINSANASTDAVNTITLTANIGLTGTLPILNPQAGSQLVINGGNNTIDGGGSQRIFFANTGDIAIRDVTLANAKAQGGDGSDNFGGGGGMGAGGAVFVRGDLDSHEGASVTLRNVAVVDNTAVGGDGGISLSFAGPTIHPGGGGGLGGNGGQGADGSGNGGQGGGGAFPGQNGNESTTSAGAQGGGPDGGAGGASGANGEQGGEFSGGGGGGDGGNGGDGGFGGGGGGAGRSGTGGDGGFGGGGGGPGPSGGTEGNGGYGGGGGVSGGQGGFGGGNGNTGGSSNNTGGGGAGMGGGLFVMEGGTLIIEDGFTVNGNTVTGGTGRIGGGFSPPPPNNGEAFGAGVFLQGSGNATFRPSAGQTQTIGDVIADEAGVVAGGYTPPAGFTPGAWSLTKQGDGTLELTGDNAFTGGTVLDGGTLSVGHDHALGSGTLTGLGGTLDIQDGISVSNDTDLQDDLDVNVDAGGTGTHAGTISGGGGLTKVGTGTLELTGDNSYSGGTVLDSGGLLIVGHDNALGTGTLTAIQGRLQIQDGITISNLLDLNGFLEFQIQASERGTYAGDIFGDADLYKAGFGTLVLSGENTNTGWRWVTQGTLQAGAEGALGHGGVVISIANEEAALDLDGFDQTVEFLYGYAEGAVRLGSATLTMKANDYNRVEGVISGTGGLVMQGTDTGTEELLGDNTYSGGTVFESGILGVGHNNALGTGTLTAIGGTFNLFDGITIANATDLQGYLNVNVEAGEQGTHAGDIGGAGVLSKFGGGTLVLSGNNTYEGGTGVYAGTLQAGAENVFGSGAMGIAAGALVDLNDFNQRIGALSGAGNVMLGAATLATGGDVDSTFSGVIGGSGALTKIGDGMLELTGDSTYTGPTTVDGGRLAVNGSIVSNVTVNNGGILGGTGQVGAVTVNDGGVYAPGNSIGTQTVNGAFTLGAGAIYEAEVNAAGEGDKVIVNGTVNLTGATLRVLAENGNYKPKTNYTIIQKNSAGAVTGKFASITSNYAFLTPRVAYDGGDGNDVVLSLLRTVVPSKGGSGTSYLSFCSVAQTDNQCNVATALHRFPTDDPLFLAVLTQTVDGARQAFDALSGEIHATVPGVLADDSRYVREAVLGRLIQAGHAGEGGGSVALAAAGPQIASSDGNAMALGYDSLSGQPAPSPLAFWTHAYGAWGNFNGDGNAATANRTLGGFVSGMDADIGGSWRAGLATGSSFSNVSVDARYSSANVQTYYLGGYAGGMAGPVALRGGGMWAWSDVETSRAVVFPGFYERQKASYDADTGQLFGEMAYPTEIYGMALEPFGGLAYVSIDSSNIHESGGPLASLRGSTNQDVGYSTAGLRAATTLHWGAMQVVPNISAAWQHAFDGVTPDAGLAFASTGIGFTVYGVPLAEDTALIDAGLDFALGERTSAGVSYTGQFGDRVTDNGVKGRFTWLF